MKTTKESSLETMWLMRVIESSVTVQTFLFRFVRRVVVVDPSDVIVQKQAGFLSKSNFPFGTVAVFYG